MFWVNSDNKIPIKSWCKEVEDSAMGQAHNLAKHPTTFHHVAVMPDCHTGYGMPIGGVIACENAVIPNAVGVDIGCGMIAIKSDFNDDISEDQIKQIIGYVRESVPVGFGHHKEPRQWEGFDRAPDVQVVRDQLDSARKQLGTLGGGNHFVEIQRGDDGFIWLMIHSGSRNFGYKIAKEYNEKAQKLCDMWKSEVCPFKGEDGLAFLPIGTREAKDYIDAMKFALEFALENRKRMMENFTAAAHGVLGCGFEDSINIHHNFASIENHFGKNVWVHRKGATQAKKDQLGIIPGSMGTSSYIVRGLGNPDSFESCSHGAGRLMGRGEFTRTHTEEECNKAMEGIVFGRWPKFGRGKRMRGVDLSEAPQAYKDIEEVIESEKDLIEVVVKLTPLGVMKG